MGEAPIRKNGIHRICFIYGKGRIPIAKNITVIDEQGNEYEATYPKRARGLVKNGRARFLSDDMICLACPPEIRLEDNDMTYIGAAGNQAAEAADSFDSKAEAAKEEGQAATRAAVPVDMEYILAQIKQIQDKTLYIHEAIEALSQMTDGDSGDCGAPGNIVGQAKAKALGDVVRCRETTNQQLLNFYMTVYDDMRHQV